RVPAAALAGFDPGEMADPAAPMDEALAGLGWTAHAIASSKAHCGPFFTCVPQWITGLWRVEWVATRPDHRRSGLAATLLDHVLAQGRRAGHRTAQLLVLVGNTPALRAYAKAGFHVEEERRHPAFEAALACPGMIEMRRAL